MRPPFEPAREILGDLNPPDTGIDLADQRNAAALRNRRRRELINEVVGTSQEMNLYELQAEKPGEPRGSGR